MNNEINEEVINQMNKIDIKSEIIKDLDSINIEDIDKQRELDKFEEAIQDVKEPPKLNKFEVNRIFNEGMDAFLKDHKNLYDCPYDKDSDQYRNMSWLEGFKNGATMFINELTDNHMKELVAKMKVDVE